MVSVAASSNMVKENGVVSSQLVMGSQPGFLTLSPSRAEQLVAREPLERWYTVENQPFARGKFAAVKRCRQTETGEVFAAKVIRKRRRGAGLTAESLHEAATLDLCRSCPHIVRLEQVFDAPGETVLVLQLAEGGELQSVLDRDEVPEERDVIRFLNQVLGGLAHLHQFDIAHLDLKPQNLVLTGPFPNCDIKLCDFGIARHIARGADVREILGTPDYVAPEVLNYEPISLATDMWSVGVLAYVLLTGCTPFGGDSKQETFCNITRCQLEFPEDLFQDVSPAAIQFISCLLVQDPSARLTAQQCLEHPWLRGGSLLDSMHMVISSSPSDSCPVSRSSTIVPDDDDDDDVARCFRDDTSSTSEETIVCGGSNRLGTPTGDPPPEAETELLDAETLSLVSAAAAASCRAADVVDTPGAPAVAATAAATAATAPNRDEDELKRSEVKSKLLAVREDFGLAWLSPKTTPSASAMKKQHLDYVSPPAATSSAWSNFGVTRRTGSLPSYRWRTSANAAAAAAAANRREASCDRTSDLGYGSDGVSEISSTDSSSDRSSIISLDDSPLEWANHPSAPRRYSDTSLAAERLWRRTWERFLPATAGTCVSLPYHLYRDQKQETGRDDRRGGPCQQPGSLLRSGSSVTCSSSSAAGSADPNGQSNNLHRRPWEKLCTGSLARAMERFNSPPPSSTVSSADGETAEATSAVGSSSQSTVAAALSTPLSSKVGSPLKVSEVRTRLLRSSSGACLSRPSGAFRTGSSSATYIKAPLLHLDQTEIVKSRLVKFRTAQATTSPAASAASATAANAVHPPSSS